MFTVGSSVLFGSGSSGRGPVPSLIVSLACSPQALQASEEKYRDLFNEMDEAYAVVEVIADGEGNWSDFLFLDANPAFMRHTGMSYPVGRTATQLLGTPNPRWAQLYGRVAETGEPLRVEEGEAALGRVFDLNIFRLGGAGSRRVAVLFTDISGRKRSEEALRESEARFGAAAVGVHLGDQWVRGGLLGQAQQAHPGGRQAHVAPARGDRAELDHADEHAQALEVGHGGLSFAWA